MSLDVTSSNSTTGAGVADSWHSVATAIEGIKTAHGADKAAIAVELGVAAAGAVLDTVAFVLDPLANLISAGLGWLIEHVSFLRWPLDQIAGNPDQIKVLADGLHSIGEDLRNTAADLDSALGAQITQWQGPGYDSFRSEMTGHRTHLEDAGKAVDTAGYVVETTMALISAVRNLFRDIITTLLGDIISTMLIALALAVVTFGASIPAGVAKCVTEGTIQGTELALQLAKVSAFASRVADRVKQLAGMTKGERPAGPGGSTTHAEPSPAASTHSGGPAGDAASTHSGGPAGDAASTHSGGPAGDAASTHTGNAHQEDPFDTWLAADAHFNGPGTPHETPPSMHGPAGDASSTQGPAGDASSTHGPAGDASSTHGPAGDASSTHGPAGDASSTHGPAGDASSTPGSHDLQPTNTTETSSTHSSDEVPPVSLLHDQNIAKLKVHEDWLKKNFAESDAKAKFVDDWVKENARDSYPLVKAMANAKSSKNWVGWVGKDIVNVDKQLTDIHQRAEKAWQQSDEKWRQDHPNPAAAT
jgi:uncharacterized protein YukE